MMSFKKIKKLICIFSLVLSLSIPTMVYASSYSTSFSFLVSVEGDTRSYSAGKIWLDIDSEEILNTSTSGIKTFSVSLYKKGFLSSTLVGSFNAKRNGNTQNGWTNMEQGNY